jgi:hypothetical protein
VWSGERKRKWPHDTIEAPRSVRGKPKIHRRPRNRIAVPEEVWEDVAARSTGSGDLPTVVIAAALPPAETTIGLVPNFADEVEWERFLAEDVPRTLRKLALPFLPLVRRQYVQARTETRTSSCSTSLPPTGASCISDGSSGTVSREP